MMLVNVSNRYAAVFQLLLGFIFLLNLSVAKSTVKYKNLNLRNTSTQWWAFNCSNAIQRTVFYCSHQSKWTTQLMGRMPAY